MPATKYTYSISVDFINSIVATDRLSLEIQTSSIITALDYINTFGDDCDIWFKDSLSIGDQAVLDGIVATHSGEALPIDNVSVKLIHPQEQFTHGYATSSGSTLTVMRATAYTSQTTNAQRSLVSSHIDDDIVRTGARTVKITYYDENMAGPYEEIVNMAGTTAVNTVNTNICYIEKMEVASVGSQLGNIGTITLKAGTAGGGVTIGTIAAGDNATYWAHHYIAENKTMALVSFIGSIKGMDTGALEIRKTIPTDSNHPECSVTSKLRIPPGTSNAFNFSVPILIVGPAMVTMYGRSDSSSNTLDWSVAMIYHEEINE